VLDMAVSDRQLNRWTLARQHLVERASLDATAAVEHLAGMQAQYSPSPYIGLWSRLEGFERADLEQALRDDRVVKTTAMRGTLHLLPASRLAHYRIVSGSSYYDNTLARLRELGVDLEAIRAHVVSRVRQRPHTRREVSRLVAGALGVTGEVPAWVAQRPTAVAAVAVTTDLVNLPDDAAFGYFGGSRYRVAPSTPEVEPAEAFRYVTAAYLAAYGPASKADLAQWSGNTVSAFAPALAALAVVSFRTEDGRTLVDLPDAPRPPPDVPVPVRFLPKWDSLLLAHARRERILPEPYRKRVIAKNGDVAPTFLVDGTVAGTWEVTLRGPAVLTLTALGRISVRSRRDVEAEGHRLLAWLRPEADSREVRWADARRAAP
jgi:hypothetical protein